MRSEVVAAVCYRVRGRRIEFLLVRTKGGGRWTFPKGHVKTNEGEKPWEAAAREAREEAGAIGYPRRTPVAHYRYPGGSLNTGGEHEVAAYMLEVVSQEPPEETFRQPSWFTPSEARQRLAEGGREPIYVAEHERVLRAAAEALGDRG